MFGLPFGLSLATGRGTGTLFATTNYAKTSASPDRFRSGLLKLLGLFAQRCGRATSRAPARTAGDRARDAGEMGVHAPQVADDAQQQAAFLHGKIDRIAGLTAPGDGRLAQALDAERRGVALHLEELALARQ